MSRRILVAYDFTDTADHALSWAVAEAQPRGDEVVLLNVLVLAPTAVAPDAVLPVSVPTHEERAVLEARLHDAAMRAGAPGVVPEVAMGASVGPTVVARAAELGAALVVLGTNERGPLARALLGSVADYVVRHAPCPVVTLRPKGH